MKFPNEEPKKAIDTSCLSCGDKFPVTKNECPTCGESRCTVDKDTLEFVIRIGGDVVRSKTLPSALNNIQQKYCPQATAQELGGMEGEIKEELLQTLQSIFGDEAKELATKKIGGKDFAYVPLAKECYFLVGGSLWRDILTGDRVPYADIVKEAKQTLAPQPVAAQGDPYKESYLSKRAEQSEQTTATPKQVQQTQSTPPEKQKQEPQQEKPKPRELVKAAVEAGGPIEAEEDKTPYKAKQQPPQPSQKQPKPKPQPPMPYDDLRETVSDLIQYTELLGKEIDAIKEPQGDADSLESRISERLDEIQARQKHLHNYTTYLGEQVETLKRTNLLGKAISDIYHGIIRKLKGKPTEQAPELVPVAQITPAAPKTAAPSIFVSMRTMDDKTKLYEFKTNDGLRAKVYEKGEKGYYSAMEYFTPAGQRSLFLLAPDKILNPADKTPVTPPSAVSDFYKAWKEQAGIAKSLK